MPNPAMLRTIAEMDDAMNELRAANAQLQREAAIYKAVLTSAGCPDVEELLQHDVKYAAEFGTLFADTSRAEIEKTQRELQEAREELTSVLNDWNAFTVAVAGRIASMRPDLAAAKAKMGEYERDAMRYRWLRLMDDLDEAEFKWIAVAIPEDIDAAIDAALAAEDKP